MFLTTGYRASEIVSTVDLDISEVVFLRQAECAPVVIVLKDVSDGVRGIRSRMQEEKCDDVCFG